MAKVSLQSAPERLKEIPNSNRPQLTLRTAGRGWAGSRHLMHHGTALPRLPEPKAGLSERELMSICRAHRTFYQGSQTIWLLKPSLPGHEVGLGGPTHPYEVAYQCHTQEDTSL